MSNSVTEIIWNCLMESIRVMDSSERLITDAMLKGEFVREHQQIRHLPLYQILKSLEIPSTLLIDEKQLILTPLAQFLAIGVVLRNREKIETIYEIREIIGDASNFQKLFLTWYDRGKFLIFIEHVGLSSWDRLSETLTDDSAEMQLLEGSLAYCNVSIDALFKFIHAIARINNFPGGLYHLGEQLTLKIQNDAVFKNALIEELPSVIADKIFRQILSSILKGIIGENHPLFEHWLNKLINDYGDYCLSDIMIALAAACPQIIASKQLLKEKLAMQRMIFSLQPAVYIQAINLARFKNDPEVRAEILKRSLVATELPELQQIVHYLTDNLDCTILPWYIEIAENIAINSSEQFSGWLAHLFEVLTQFDLHLVYRLQTKRFLEIGSTSFVQRHWYSLIQKDKAAFQVNLTRWFNLGERNVYSAILRLSSITDINEADFILSQEELAKLSPRDKLFIGVKIAGFIYGKDQLQSLMFSLIESLQPEEMDVMTELFNIMFNYVVYNYRSILEQVKIMVTDEKLPSHLHSFYQALDEHYEQYFEQLRQVKDFVELRPESKLSQHIQFYTQRKFSDEFNSAPRPAWAEFGKTIPLPSHRWAIRRENEPVHQPQPLSHIETTAEFPSGERLNPIFQETLRRTYQKIERNEININ